MLKNEQNFNFIIYPTPSIFMAVTNTFNRAIYVTSIGQTYLKLKFQKAQTGANRFEYST